MDAQDAGVEGRTLRSGGHEDSGVLVPSIGILGTWTRGDLDPHNKAFWKLCPLAREAELRFSGASVGWNTPWHRQDTWGEEEWEDDQTWNDKKWKDDEANSWDKYDRYRKQDKYDKYDKSEAWDGAFAGCFAPL